MINQIIQKAKKIVVEQLTNTQKVSLMMSDYIHPEILKSDDEYVSRDMNIAMYHGTRGSSKSETIVREMWLDTRKGFGSEWKGVIFRKNNKDLLDIFNKFKKFLTRIKSTATFINSTGNLKIEFKTGEVIYFRQLESMRDYEKYHGGEFTFIVLEEATLWSDIDDIVASIITTIRTNYNIVNAEDIENGKKKKLISKIRILTNPFGAGKEKLKRMFIDKNPAGVPFVDFKTTHFHIKSSWIDNIFLPKSYSNSMDRLTNNKEKLKAWKYGDWSAKASGAFGDLFNNEIFVMRPFKIPRNWYVDRAMDWGTTAPYSMLYFAESDGTQIDIRISNDKTIKFKPPRGSIIVIGEVVGADLKKGRNVGLQHTVAQACKVFTQKEIELKASILEKGHKISDGIMDYAIKARTGHEVTLEQLFNNQGFYFEDCIKYPNSRAFGVELMQEYMKNTISNSATEPHIYFFDTCPEAIEDIFSLEYDEKKPDDVQTNGVPDHSWDCLRYRLLHKAPKIKIHY